MKEIKYEDLVKLPEDSYVLIDIRDDELRAYGMIPGSLSIDLSIDENIIKEKIDSMLEKYENACIVWKIVKKLFCRSRQKNVQTRSNLFNHVQTSSKPARAPFGPDRDKLKHRSFNLFSTIINLLKGIRNAAIQ